MKQSTSLLVLLLFYICPNGYLFRASAEFFQWNYPACWETSHLKAAPALPLPSNYHKMVVIGDIHGNWNGLLENLEHAGLIMAKQCEWKRGLERVLLVQTGDVVDRGRFATECFECLQHLQATAERFGHQVIRLLGNHELMWLGAQYDYRNTDSDTMLKINKLTKKMVDDILQKKLFGSFYTNIFGGVPILFTHAGLRKEMKSNILSRASFEGSEGETVSAFVNEMLYRNTLECYNSRGYTDSYKGKIRCGIYLTDVIYSVGKERRGNSIGGVMWTDYHILEQEANDTLWDFVQVVGHTLQKGKIRTTLKLMSTCVDAGMMMGGRAYLSVSSEGRFSSFEKQNSGEWKQNDLTTMMCL
jgi:hypothetical protein